RSEVTGTLHWLRDATHVPPNRAAEQLPAGSWNQMEIELKGRSLRASINGKSITDITLAVGARFPDGTVPGLNRLKGRLGLRKHHGTARFRNIRIKELVQAHDRKGRIASGTWRVEREELVHSDAGTDNGRLLFGDPNWTDYDYSFEATKTRGPFGISAL